MVQIDRNQIFLAIIYRLIEGIFKIESTSFTISYNSIAIPHKDQISKMVDSLEGGHLCSDPLVKNKHNKVSCFKKLFSKRIHFLLTVIFIFLIWFEILIGLFFLFLGIFHLFLEFVVGGGLLSFSKFVEP